MGTEIADEGMSENNTSPRRIQRLEAKLTQDEALLNSLEENWNALSAQPQERYEEAESRLSRDDSNAP